MATFYSFKNKKNESEPLIKEPGSIDGQMFDIADCEGSTMVLMDQCEQVQIDEVHKCRVFIGACTSSIFIRNCSNCVFYTCCRQLRLRDCTDCKFFIYSMAEVHIEYSNRLAFGPFNGGYPDHAKHMAAANLDVSHNLWYDIFDHNDPGKTHEHWRVMEVSEYEEPWFPAGECERAIPVTAPGSVARVFEDSGMQSYGVDQMAADAAALSAPAPPTGPASEPAPSVENVPPPPAPSADMPVNRLCVGIIGTSAVALALAGRLSSAGYSVHLGTAEPDLEKVLTSLGDLPDNTSVSTVEEACVFGNFIILAVSGMRSAELYHNFAVSLGAGVKGKIVLDATNPLSEYPKLEVIWDGNTSGGEMMQAALPDCHVFKAFNTTGSNHIANPTGSDIPGYDSSIRGPLKMLFAGPKEQQVNAAEIISAVGFTPLYVGPIRYSRNLEAMAELWVHLALPPVGETTENWGKTFHFEPSGV
eukprot:CAMPEP_0185023132 /NCGR_PEP_ID=MMETSP1103-20130426/5826_1 /TAXON_ID=36769 /ORGANISM="Paraphysomonas bandaiensis, Strain Caron Lab Isolate" /LENGTH=472 /DNA_ID=CAMNT_0027555569 /DNA_START=99 /DNA_END=1517 /DNA_ORIENTATION=+